MNPLFSTARRQSQNAFSLLEVIIAMGIVASVMLALVGVMPRGIESLHEASVTSIESRIAQEIISEAQSADWNRKRGSTAAQLNPILWEMQGLRYYDRTGRQQKNRNENVGEPSVYNAKIEILSDTGEAESATSAVKIQGRQFYHLRRIKVWMEYTPGGIAPTFSTDDPKRRVKIFTGLVANMGKDDDAVR